ncbi:MAG: helix-turn-helix transcriptional regulator [Proteobacteria bacterium]|nr:helix-turn-helix transcriptional regulator [Pseudomonadota bacterium]
MKKLLSTKEVAQRLGVNEKMVYTLIAEKGLPASKVTGKWLFPNHLVEQWVESRTINYPEHRQPEPREDLLIICGSNDLLLERTLSLFMSLYPDQTAVFGNLGSLGGLKALRRGVCHMASSHLAQDRGEEYNFSFAREVLQELPAVVNFARREQGLVLAPGNPKRISDMRDLGSKNLTVINRPLGTGTRLLFDRELEKAGVDVSTLVGYGNEVHRHMDVGLEILAGRADCGPAIRPVAGLLGLEFMPLAWERFDLLIPKDRFFDKAVQLFLNMLPDKALREMAEALSGYDMSMTGKMVFPG